MARKLYRSRTSIPDVAESQIVAARKIISERAAGGRAVRRITTPSGKKDRIVFLLEGRRIAVEFEAGNTTPSRIVELNEDHKAVKSHSLKEAKGGMISDILKRVSGDKKSKDVEVPQETVELKSNAYAKDVMRGSDVFLDCERKVRLFLRGAGGLGNQQLFIIYGSAGIGKSVGAKSALVTECGPVESPIDTHKRIKSQLAFEPADFKVRVEASEAIEQAKRLYQRYLHNYTLSRKSDTLVPETDEDLKHKALQAVKTQLEDKLYGYDLSLDDVEGGGARAKKTASDPIEKLKRLGSEDMKVAYSPKNGWLEGPSSMSDEDLYLQLYSANSRALFIDEADYFLKNPNPAVKKALDNKPFRYISSGSKSGYVEVGGFILPDSFWYSGRMVFTTNLTPKDFDDAIRTRAASYGLYLSLDQLFDRLRDIMPKIQANDLPHLPPVVLTGVRNILKKFSDQGELKQFDFRTFVLLADEYALLVDDAVKAAREENPAFPDFNIYIKPGDSLQAADEAFKAWRLTPEGQQVSNAVGRKFKKVILNQIQAMNRASARDAEVMTIKQESDEDAA